MKRNTLINRALTLALSVTLITTLSVPTITAFGADPTGEPTPTPTGELSGDPIGNPSNTPSPAAQFEALVESLPNPTDVTPGDADIAATAAAAQEAYEALTDSEKEAVTQSKEKLDAVLLNLNAKEAIDTQANSLGSGAITWGEGFQEVTYQVELADGRYSDPVVLNSGEAIKLPANYADNGDGEVFVDFRMKMKDGYLPTSWTRWVSTDVPFYSAEKGDFYIPLILDTNDLRGITLKAEQAEAVAQIDTPYGDLYAGVVDEWRTRLFASFDMVPNYIGMSEPVGETLKLLADVDLGSTVFNVPSGVHLALDMNGHNLTGSANFVLAVTGTVKIDDTSGAALPGAIINSAKAGIIVDTPTGSLTIDKVAVKSLGSGSRAVFVRDGGSFLMTGGRLEGSTGLRVINRIASAKSSATISGGKIVGANNGIFLLGNTASTKSAASEPWPVEVTVKEAAHIEASGGPAVTVTGNGSVLNVEGGMLTGGPGYGAISGNGINDEIKNEGGTVINISGGTIKGVTEHKNDGSVASSGNGIYHPQTGVLNVTGGTITADTGIEMRGGTLNVRGGTITGTMTPANVNSNGSGSTTDGVGISVAQHVTIPAIDVTISGGEINGFTAFYQSSPETESDPSIVSVSITGGTFSTINGGTLVVYSENKTDFITGGTFSSLLDVAYYDESTYKQNALDAVVEPGKVVPLVVNPPAPDPGPDPEPEPEKPIIKVEVPPTPDEGHYVTIPETTVEKATEHVQNVLDTIVAGEVPAGMNEEQANEIAAVLDKAQSPEEIEIVLSLQAEPKEAHEVDSTEREAVEGVSGEGEEPTVFFDLSVLMTVKVKGGGGARETTVKLSAVDEPLLFEIHVDPELVRGKNVRIAHVHDGITEVYNPESVDREVGIVRLHAAKFSTYALLTSTSCTVSFESNGGSPVNGQGIPFGGTVVRPADPTRDGFVFAGWFTDEALTAAYDFAKPVDKSFVLYAKWTPVTNEPGQDPSGTPGQDPNQTPGGNTNQPTRLDTPSATKDSPLARLLSTGEGPAATFALVAAMAALVSALVAASALRRRRTH